MSRWTPCKQSMTTTSADLGTTRCGSVELRWTQYTQGATLGNLKRRHDDNTEATAKQAPQIVEMPPQKMAVVWGKGAPDKVFSDLMPALYGSVSELYPG